jgi:hypothetical protein
MSQPLQLSALNMLPDQILCYFLSSSLITPHYGPLWVAVLCSCNLARFIRHYPLSFN